MSNSDRGQTNRGSAIFKSSRAASAPPRVLPLALLLLVGGSFPVFAQTAAKPPTLEDGYRQMYNLQFTDAHSTFKTWEDLHPNDPFGPTSDGAAYLFSEFDRMGVLQSEL